MVGLNRHFLKRHSCPQNSSFVDQLPLRLKSWQGQSQLLGCMQVTVKARTLDIEATAASGRNRLRLQPYLISAAEKVDSAKILEDSSVRLN